MADPLPAPPAPEIVAARPLAALTPLDELRPLTARPARAPRLDLSLLTRGAAALDLGLVVVAALLLPIGTPLVLGALAGSEAGLSSRYPSHGVLIVEKYLEALLVVVLLAYLVYRHRLPAQAFGLQTHRLGRQFAWGAAALGGTYAAMMASVIPVAMLVWFVPQTQQDLTERAKFMQILPIQDVLASILLLVPVAIHEEVLFRALLIPYLRRLTGNWTLAIALSTVLFAALHITQGWLAVLQILLVGAALASFYVWSRSLLAVILAHFAFDFLQLQVARLLLPFIEKYAPGSAAGLIG